MAFLDNSGDIILDAVLTDTGRMRLAKGDGSFRIVKFALGDDEIDYSLYNKNHSSGSAYFDIEILQTPVLEAFTNNFASVKSKLISLGRNDFLYLPVVKVNNLPTGKSFANNVLVQNGYVMAVDTDTQTFLATSGRTYNGTSIGSNGILKGVDNTGPLAIRIDQGIDNSSLPPAGTLDPNLRESQYIVEIDNKFAILTNPSKSKDSVPSYIDDDDVATYYLSENVDTEFVKDLKSLDPNGTSTDMVIAGQRGTYLEFSLRSALEVQTSTYLFDQLGTDVTALFNGSPTSVKTILTSIRVVGVTTGAFVDIPLLLVKKQ